MAHSEFTPSGRSHAAPGRQPEPAGGLRRRGRRRLALGGCPAAGAGQDHGQCAPAAAGSRGRGQPAPSSTRRQSLTDAGEAFCEAARRIVLEAQEAIAAAGQDSAEPRGLLRITAPNDYAATVVAPVAVALRRRHPALKVELLAADRVLDLLKEGVDVAIRAGRLADSGLQATRIGSFREWLVASPQMFGPGGAPGKPEPLAALPFIALSVLSQPLAWTFTSPSGRSRRTLRFEPSMTANTSHAVRSAALSGGGLAVLPDYAVAADVAAGRLLRLLPDWSLPESGIHAVFPAARHRPRKVRVFLEALRAHVEANGGLTA